MASNASAYSIPVESAEACTSGKATTIFEVSGSFENVGESILLIGSIPELGGWDTSKAIALSNLDAESAGAPSFGGRFDIAEGTTFEYKYIMQEADGSRSWECCENREFTVPADSACSDQSVDVGWFRGGDGCLQVEEMDKDMYECMIWIGTSNKYAWRIVKAVTCEDLARHFAE